MDGRGDEGKIERADVLVAGGGPSGVTTDAVPLSGGTGLRAEGVPGGRMVVRYEGNEATANDFPVSVTPMKIYTWTAIGLIWYRMICIAAVLGLAFVGLDVLMNAGNFRPDDILGIAIVSLGLVFAIWAIVYRTPIRAEFSSDRLTFTMPFGRRIVVTESDVLTANKGHSIGRFRIPGSTGTILRLRWNPTLHISTNFAEYQELASRLASLTTRNRRDRAG